MNITNSSNSNYSGTSSETSETLSIDDTNSNSNSVSTPPAVSPSNSRIPKSWQRMSAPNAEKDAESKRPPWRAVSVSTLPKPDKSAILRAKLLDASRRMRAAKVTVAVQTDPEPTKLMKEVKLGVQTDLVARRDASMVTDGLYAKKREGSQEFVLTYSVAQLTDAVQVVDATTQTLLPRIPADEFMEAYLQRGGDHPGSLDAQKFTETQRKLLQQIAEIRQSHKNEDFPSAPQSPRVQRGSLLRPTLASWNFEYDEIGSERYQSWSPYIMYASDALKAPRGDPRHARGQMRNLLCAIDEILAQSSRLLDVVDRLRPFGRDGKNTRSDGRPATSPGQSTPATDSYSEEHLFPSMHWIPIVEAQEKRFDELLQRLHNRQRQVKDL